MDSSGLVATHASRVWRLVFFALVSAACACASSSRDRFDSDRDGGGDGSVAAIRSALAIDDADVAPIAAYSTALKLRSGYAGSAFRVRRASDNAELDVGFTASSRVNAGALPSFCGSSDCFLVTLYDQSGNAQDLAQSTVANEIEIYDGAARALVGGYSYPIISVTSPGKSVVRGGTLGLSGNPAFTIAYAGRYFGGATNQNEITLLSIAGVASTINNSIGVGFGPPVSGPWMLTAGGHLGWASTGNESQTHRGVLRHAAGAPMGASTFRFNGLELGAPNASNNGSLPFEIIPSFTLLGKSPSNNNDSGSELSSVLVWDAMLGDHDLALVEQLLDPALIAPPSTLCYGAPGAQALSPWPMVGLCPMHRGQSPAKGAQSNARRWTPAQIGTGNIRGSVAIAADGTIFAASSGRLAAVNPSTGAQTLTASARSPGSSVAIGSDGTVYSITSFNTLEARHPSAWSAPKWTVSLGSNASTGPVIGPDGTVYVTSSNGKLRAITPAGAEKWPALTFAQITGASPAIGGDGTIYVGADDGLHAVNPNGTLKWNLSLGSNVFVRTTPAIGADGKIYLGTDSNKLVAVTPGATSGTISWTFPTGGAIRSAPAVANDGTIYFGSRDHKVYAVNPNGSAKWPAPRSTGSNVDSSPAIGSDGVIYIGSDDSRLYALRPADGTVLFSYNEGNAIRGAVAIGRDGTVYAGADDAKLIALGSGTNSCAASDTTCDGIDDDCNGLLDDGYVSTTSSCGVGACARAAATSCTDGAVRTSTCTPGAPATSFDLTCDGIDDDCNGTVDDLCGGNLALNGTFETGVTPNQGLRTTSGGVVTDPELLQWERTDTNGTAGALRVKLTPVAGQTHYHDTGAFISLSSAVPAGSWIAVSFRAKSLSGGTLLSMQSAWGGGTPRRVRITNGWASYQVHMQLGVDTSGLVLNLVPADLESIQLIDAGDFLLDDIQIQYVPQCTSASCGTYSPDAIFGSSLREVWDSRLMVTANGAGAISQWKGTRRGLALQGVAPHQASWLGAASDTFKGANVVTASASPAGYLDAEFGEDLVPAGTRPYVAVVGRLREAVTEPDTVEILFQLRKRAAYDTDTGAYLGVHTGPYWGGEDYEDPVSEALYLRDYTASAELATIELPQLLAPGLIELWGAADGVHFAQNGVERRVPAGSNGVLAQALRYLAVGGELGGDWASDMAVAQVVVATEPTAEQRAAFHQYVRDEWGVAVDSCSAASACAAGDSCCPSTCSASDDSDCVRLGGSGDPCTGVTACIGGDGCCLEGCETSDGDCPPIAPCTIDHPCGNAEAGCSDDRDCEPGLTCGFGVGPRFGLPADVGVCWDAAGCGTSAPNPEDCGSVSAHCGTCCIPDCSASGEPDGCGGTCGSCVATADSDADGLLDCDEQQDGDPWTDPHIFNGLAAGLGPSCHSAATCAGIDSANEILGCYAPFEQVGLSAGWDFTTSNASSCQAGFGFQPAWSSCTQNFSVGAAGVIRLEEGTHCFLVSGSSSNQCGALFLGDQQISNSSSGTACVTRPAGVYPISFYYETTNTSQNDFHVRYCKSAQGSCTPTAVLSSRMLRKPDDGEEHTCDENSPCSELCPCSAGRVCNPSAPFCGPGLECRGGVGPRFGQPADVAVCYAPECDGQPTRDFPCGSTHSYCGECLSCPASCAGKSCGWDGCYGTCGATCGAGQAGCERDSDCGAGLVCGRDNGARFGLVASARVCWPANCEGPSPTGTCGSTSSACGTCPACVPRCDGRSCGDNGCGGSCGTCASGETCDPSGGVCVGAPLPLLPPNRDLTITTAPVGTIDGDLSVSDTGDAVYTVPIVVPPGRGGIQPELALTYSSSAGRGYLGLGWKLDGISTITRCNKTVAQDGFAEPPQFNTTDAFCLDGQRMRYENGRIEEDLPGRPPTATFNYRLEDDRFARIQALYDYAIVNGTYTYIGPRQFNVLAKDGRVFEYTPFADAISQPQGGSTFPKADLWVLTAVKDRTTVNIMHIEYRHSAFMSNGGMAREYYPDSISYGPESSPIVIDFVYSTDPELSEGRGRTIKTYERGIQQQINSLLRRIDVRVNGATVRHYEIDYDRALVLGIPLLGLREQLTSISECVGDGLLCKPATRFNYAPGDTVPPERFHAPVRIGNELNEVAGPGETPIPTYVLDLNGDGLDDVLFPSYRTSEPWCRESHSFWNTYISKVRMDGPDAVSSGHEVVTSSVFTQDTEVCPSVLGIGGSRTQRLISDGSGAPIDFDNDGRQELLETTVLTPDGGAPTPDYTLVGWDPATGTLKRTRTGLVKPELGFTHLADLDGDGHKDILSCEASTTPVAWRIVMYNPNTVPHYQGPGTMMVLNEPCDGKGAVPIDLFGTGVEAMVFNDHAITIDPQAHFVRRFDLPLASFFDIPSECRTVAMIFRDRLENTFDCPFMRSHVLDINGDGLKDILQIKERDVRIAINRGDGTFDSQSATLDKLPTSSVILDIDLDGLDDLIWGAEFEFFAWRSNGSTIVPSSSPVPLPVKIDPRTTVTRFATTIDSDGDGVPGLITAPTMFLLERDGAARDRLVSATDGLGARSTISYLPLTDPRVYEQRLFAAGGTALCDFPFLCVQPRHQVVRYVNEFDDTAVPSTPARIFRHDYTDARFDAQGRGALGFAAHTVHQLTPDFARSEKRSIRTEFDNGFAVSDPSDPRQVFYPKAFRPSRITDTSFFTGYQYVTEQTNTWNVSGTLPKVFASQLDKVTREEKTVASDGTVTSLGATSTEVLERDGRGNATRTLDTFADETILVEQSYKHLETTSFDDNWLISLPTSRVETSDSLVTGQQRVRSTSRDYYDNGLLRSESVDAGDPDHALHTFYTRNVASAWQTTDIAKVDAALNTRSTHIDYDALKEYPTAIQNSLGQTTEVSYDRTTGQQLSSRDPNSLQSDWFYDGFGRLAATIAPDFVATTYNYAVGTPELPMSIETATEGGERTLTELDIHGRPATIHDFAFDRELITNRTYDRDGNLYTETRPTQAGQSPSPGGTRIYDNLHRVTLETTPSGHTTSYCYDVDTSCVTTARNFTTCTTHDQRGRPVVMHDPVPGPCQSVLPDITPLSNGIHYTYANFGARASTYDQAGFQVIETRDNWSRTTRLDDPDVGVRDFTYNAFGELTRVSDSVGREIDYSYDLLGRLYQRDDLESGQTRTTSWTWDGGSSVDYTQGELIGAVTSNASPDGVEQTFRYDASGRLRIATTRIANESFDITYGYQDGRLSRIDYPGPTAGTAGLSVSYGYDGFGHVRSLSDANAPSGALPYWRIGDTDINGLLRSELFANQVTTTRSYNVDGQLATLDSTALFGSPLQSLEYGYYDDGMLWTRKDNVRSGRTTTYDYDRFGRIQSDDSAGGRTYAYDAIGNLSSGTFNRPQPHQMSSDGVNTYDYVAGNRTLKSRAGFVEKTSYTGFNMPAQIWNEETPNQQHDVLTFSYDADQQRVRKQGPAGTTVYIGALAERRTPASGPATFVYYLDNGNRPVAQVSVTGTNAPVVTYLHDDRIGTVHVISSSPNPTTGEITSTEFDYDAFGLRRSPAWTGPVPANTTGVTLGFTSDESDDERGLINMGGRLYDPATRQFTSFDPLRRHEPITGSLSPYSYANNNPLTFIDPTGFDAEVGNPDDLDASEQFDENGNLSEVTFFEPQDAPYTEESLVDLSTIDVPTWLLPTGDGPEGIQSTPTPWHISEWGSEPHRVMRQSFEEARDLYVDTTIGSVAAEVGAPIIGPVLARIPGVSYARGVLGTAFNKIFSSPATQRLVQATAETTVASRSGTAGAMKLVSYGEKSASKLKQHWGDIQRLAREHGVELPHKFKQAGGDIEKFIDDLVATGRTVEGPYKPTGGGWADALWTRNGNAIVIRSPEGRFVTLLDASRGGAALNFPGGL